MSCIQWEDWFDILQDEVDYLESLIGQDIINLQTEQITQNNRLDVLDTD